MQAAKGDECYERGEGFIRVCVFFLSLSQHISLFICVCVVCVCVCVSSSLSVSLSLCLFLTLCLCVCVCVCERERGRERERERERDRRKWWVILLRWKIALHWGKEKCKERKDGEIDRNLKDKQTDRQCMCVIKGEREKRENLETDGGFVKCLWMCVC